MHIENFIPITKPCVFCRRAETLEFKDRKLIGMHSPCQRSKHVLDYMDKFFHFYKTSIYNSWNCIKFPLKSSRIHWKNCNYNLNKLSEWKSGFQRDELLAWCHEWAGIGGEEDWTFSRLTLWKLELNGNFTLDQSGLQSTQSRASFSASSAFPRFLCFKDRLDRIAALRSFSRSGVNFKASV